MTTFVRELIAGANQALAEVDRKRTAPLKASPSDIDVVAIRRRLRLSQLRFARRFGVPVSTLRDWELKRSRPDAVAANLLRIIDHDPEIVERALGRMGTH